MSFISAQTEKMEMLYGKPDCLSTSQKMTAEELAVVRASMKDGRAHDITLYIKKGDGYIFIAKPFIRRGCIVRHPAALSPARISSQAPKEKCWRRPASISNWKNIFCE